MERGTIGFEQERNAVISNEMRISFPLRGNLRWRASACFDFRFLPRAVRRTKRRAEWSSRSPPRNTEKWHYNNMDCCTAGYGQERYDDICHGVRPWRLSFHPFGLRESPVRSTCAPLVDLAGRSTQIASSSGTPGSTVSPTRPGQWDQVDTAVLVCALLLQWVVGAAGPLGRRSVL